MCVPSGVCGRTVGGCADESLVWFVDGWSELPSSTPACYQLEGSLTEPCEGGAATVERGTDRGLGVQLHRRGVTGCTMSLGAVWPWVLLHTGDAGRKVALGAHARKGLLLELRAHRAVCCFVCSFRSVCAALFSSLVHWQRLTGGGGACVSAVGGVEQHLAREMRGRLLQAIPYLVVCAA